MKEVKAKNSGLRLFEKWEFILYFSIYISYLIYGISELIALRFKILEISKFEFSPGWHFINSPRDDSNDDLESFILFIQRNWLWYVLHVIMSMALQNGVLRRPGISYAVMSTMFITTTFHGISIACICVLLFSYYVLSKTASKISVWILSGVWMVFINVMKRSVIVYDALGYDEFLKLFIFLSWTMLRCSSFVLNRIKNTPSINIKEMPRGTGDNELEKFNETYSMENFLGYTLYFPTLIYGPFMGFQRYIVIQNVSNRAESNLCLLWFLCKGLLRWFLWWCVMNFTLHFLYIHYMERDINAIRLVKNPFCQYAITYCMGQSFFMFYVITYGLAITIAKFDGLNPPNPPKCVSCVNSYSKMWKFFDEGLYEFLFQHIYTELCKKNSTAMKKLLAALATFAFTFVWHGFFTYVLIWTSINLVCLIAEKILNNLTSSRRYFELITLNIGYQNSQRLKDLIATQIFIPASYSNLYFFGGTSTGNWLMRGAYCSGIKNYLLLTCCCYAFTQSSEIISNHMNSKKKVKKCMEQ